MKHPDSERFGPEIESALEELRARILERYPAAAFDVFHHDDPDGVRLRVTVDVEDSDTVLDTVIDTLYDVQVERHLPIYVIPVQSLAYAGRSARATAPAPGQGRLRQ